MKTLKTPSILILCVSLIIVMNSCKARKLAQKPATPPVAATKPVEVQKPVTTPVAASAPTPEKPNFDFSNIQFDFNSFVLKTSSITALDNVAAEIKKFPTNRFMLNGFASAEGTAKHNMVLSKERAIAVKTYLINAGVPISDLNTKGYGEKDPIASNKSEAGRELNRRVEIKLI